MSLRLACGVVAAFVLALPAYADEAYVCDGGRIVYVKMGQLEHLKRTDPCIAAHYGLTVERPAPATVATPEKAKAQAAPAAAPKLQFKSLDEPALARRAPAAAPPVPRAASAAGPNTDFRNIPILNATPGADTLFRHAR